MVTLQAIGHLGKDAIVKDINGKTVINFSVAHSQKIKKTDGTEVNKTLWVECAWWTERTKIASFLKKGTQVHVSGTPALDTYRNSENVTVATLRLRVGDVVLLGSKREEGSTEAATAHAAEQVTEGETMDDLPF